MGWFNSDYPHHEGYVIGLAVVPPPILRCTRTPRKAPHDCQRKCPADRYGTPCVPRETDPLYESFATWLNRGDRFRELTRDEITDGRTLVPAGILDAGDFQVARIQVACECGWRSALLAAPSGTVWSRWSTELHPDNEEICARIWHQHAEGADRFIQHYSSAVAGLRYTLDPCPTCQTKHRTAEPCPPARASSLGGRR